MDGEDVDANTNMRRRRLLATVLILAFVAGALSAFVLIFGVSAQPTYVNSWSAGFASVSIGAVTVATTASDTVIVIVGEKVNTCMVSSITDNAAGGSSTYTRKLERNNTIRWELWGTAVGAAKAATSITVNLAGGPCKMQVAVGDFSGATNYGNSATASNTNANPTQGIVIQEANGMAVGGFTTNDATAPTAGSVSTLRKTICSTGGAASTRSCSSLTTHIQATGGGTGTADETHAAIAWAGGAVELRNQGTLISVSCVSSGTPLTMNSTVYVLGFVNYIRMSCTADGKAYTTAGSIAATPTFTLPAPFTELWSFLSSTATGTTCAGGSSAWQMTSGSQHTFPSGATNWDYCALIPSTATADSTSFTVAWNSP